MILTISLTFCLRSPPKSLFTRITVAWIALKVACRMEASMLDLRTDKSLFVFGRSASTSGQPRLPSRSLSIDSVSPWNTIRSLMHWSEFVTRKRPLTRSLLFTGKSRISLMIDSCSAIKVFFAFIRLMFFRNKSQFFRVSSLSPTIRSL